MRISDWSSDVCSSDLDRLDDARGFMAGDRGEGVRIGAVDEMQIRMAKPARDGADTHLVRGAVGDNDIFDLQWLTGLDQYNGFGHLKLTSLSARPEPVEGPFFLQA